MGNNAIFNTTASEAERTGTEIRNLLKICPELGMNQESIAALEKLPRGIIITAQKAGPIGAKAVINKALTWRGKLLEEYPDLAQNPAQFTVALETPEEYVKDRSNGKQAARDYQRMKYR